MNSHLRRAFSDELDPGESAACSRKRGSVAWISMRQLSNIRFRKTIERMAGRLREDPTDPADLHELRQAIDAY